MASMEHRLQISHKRGRARQRTWNLCQSHVVPAMKPTLAKVVLGEERGGERRGFLSSNIERLHF